MSKFRVAPKEKRMYKGILYDSKLEREYAEQLDLSLKGGSIQSWTRQHKFPIAVNGTHIKNYFIDFAILHNDGHTEYVELKGMWTPLGRLTWKLFLALYESDLTSAGHSITLIQPPTKRERLARRKARSGSGRKRGSDAEQKRRESSRKVVQPTNRRRQVRKKEGEV